MLRRTAPFLLLFLLAAFPAQAVVKGSASALSRFASPTSRVVHHSISAHLTSAQGQNEKPVLWGSCQLPPAADTPPNELM